MLNLYIISQQTVIQQLLLTDFKNFIHNECKYNKGIRRKFCSVVSKDINSTTNIFCEDFDLIIIIILPKQVQARK